MHGSSHRSVRRKSVLFTLAGVTLTIVLLLSGLPAAYARSAVEIAGSSFKSTFTNNTAGWSVVSGNWKKTGSGYYQGNATSSLLYESVAHDNQYDSFSLTARVRASGDGRNLIIVRGTPLPLHAFNSWDDGYHFLWDNTGLFMVAKRLGGTETVLLGWSYSSAINPYGWNVLRVDMTGTYMAFFINNQLVFAGSDASLSSGQVGLGFLTLADTDRLNIDYVKLKVVTP